MQQEKPPEIMVPFRYVDFYDVPRLMMVRYEGRLFLLASYFHEDRDDYDQDYSISIVPSWVERRIEESSWKVLEDDVGAKFLGTIPVTKVVFDKTMRQSLGPTFLKPYLAPAL